MRKSSGVGYCHANGCLEHEQPLLREGLKKNLYTGIYLSLPISGPGGSLGIGVPGGLSGSLISGFNGFIGSFSGVPG